MGGVVGVGWCRLRWWLGSISIVSSVSIIILMLVWKICVMVWVKLV